jgi:pentatricopeptide repeat protein
MAQWLSQKISSIGHADKRPLTIVLCLAFCVLAGVFVSVSGSGGEGKPQIDILLMVVALAYLIGQYSAGSGTARPGAKAINEKIAKVPIQAEGKAPDGGRRAKQGSQAVEPPAPGKESSADGEDQVTSDMRILERVQKEGVVPKASHVKAAMEACVRCNSGDTALKLFDQMLEGGAVPDVHLLCKSTASKFFKLVAESLDDKRMREEGLRFLDVIRAHKLSPSTLAQNLLIVAFRSKPPDNVLAYFVKMKESGVMLSSTAYRCIMAANERTGPEITLKLYEEMQELGIKLDRVAYNAVLCALSQLNMLDRARQMFMEMDSAGLVPNGKTYGIMIKVYYSSNRPKEAVAIFDTMREQRLEPDRFAYHHAINSCIKLQRLEYAVELYKAMVQAKLPPCDNTHIYLSAACKKQGWTTTAEQIMKDLEHVKQAHAARGSPPRAAAAAGAE